MRVSFLSICLWHRTLGLRLPIHAPPPPAVKRVSVFMSTDDQVTTDNDPPPSDLAAQICDLAEALPDHLVCSGSSTVPVLSAPEPSLSARLSLRRRALAGGGPTVEDVLAACAQAPVGRGTETVVDTSVRRVMESERIAVQWPGLPAALEQVQLELCPWLDLEAKLYKVLVYRKGDFFTWHLDSKKEQDHVLTLTVDCGAPTCEGGGIEFVHVPAAQWRSDANPVFNDDDREAWYKDKDNDWYDEPPDWYDDEMRKKYVQFCDERGYGIFTTQSFEDDDYAALKQAWSNELRDRQERLEEEADARKKKRLWSADAPGDWCCWSITEQHRVRQVTSGCRVVAVYNVLGRQRQRKELTVPRPEGVLPLQEPSGASPEQRRSKLVNMLSEPPLTRALQASGYHRVGFLLHHEYNFDTRYGRNGYREPYRMPLSELMGRDRVLYEAALAAGHSVVQVEQCTLRYEVVLPDSSEMNYRLNADDLGSVRVARSTMDQLTLVKDGGPTVYEWLNSIQYHPDRKFEVPDQMKPYVGADTITPEEASFICRHLDHDERSHPRVNDVYWPFRDVWWACSESSIKRQFDATKKFTGSDSGEFGYPLWGNSAQWDYYAHGRAVLLVQIRSGDTQTSTDSPRPLANDL